MRRDEKGIRRGFESDLQQVVRIDAENRAPVGFDVADAGQARRHARRGLEIGGVDEIVHLAHAIAAAVDAADLDRQHETHRRATGSRNFGVHCPGRLLAQGIEAVPRGHQLVAQLSQPAWMSEVARGDHSNPFALGPAMDLLQVQFLAGRPRQIGVDVQVSREPHGGRSVSSLRLTQIPDYQSSPNP